ncbi:MAG: glucuronate isomerase [Lachnospiraceae bacterium]|nr:glucuronate isomerase [Lachnospiraceae bacterium]
MKPFMDDDFLLSNETAKKLYNDCAKDMPIIDYHCHIDAKEIAENKEFKNITELWLGGDHYKWRFMRAAGINEKYITGDASDKEKFLKWINALSLAFGNPLYHWSHMELKKYFGFEGYVTSDKGEELWEKCNSIISSGNFRAKDIINMSNVKVLCTTDDPADSLEYHDIIREDSSFSCKVLPAFRPDNAMNLEKKEFTDYISKLSKVCGFEIKSYEDLKEALKERMKFFDTKGCRLADHGLVNVPFLPVTYEEADGIFKKRLEGTIPSFDECEKFRTSFLLFVHEEYAKLGWVSQLHYGCKRDNNTKMFESVGPNTGYDCIASRASGNELADFLDALNKKNALGKIILYSLNPNDNEILDTICACFQDGESVNKIQHGSAWWFNDNLGGMSDQLKSLALNGNLPGFVGMLTDSRSFVSYTRHDYFRRILANYIGSIVENGEFPEDYELLEKIIKDISYNNALNYFGF